MEKRSVSEKSFAYLALEAVNLQTLLLWLKHQLRNNKQPEVKHLRKGGQGEPCRRLGERWETGQTPPEKDLVRLKDNTGLERKHGTDVI